VLHVLYLFWDNQEGCRVKTCLQNACSDKLRPLDLIFHSNRIQRFEREKVRKIVHFDKTCVIEQQSKFINKYEKMQTKIHEIWSQSSFSQLRVRLLY
jgi:hypothetical protein